MNRIIFSSLALPILTTTATAQFPPAGGYQPDVDPTNTISHTVNTVGRMVFGEIAGDQLPGALAVINGDAVGIFDPGMHDSTFVVHTGANDVAMIDPVGSGPAGMIVARIDGVWLCELDTDPNATTAITKTNIAAGYYMGLDMIREAYIDGVGRQDLLGVEGSSIHLLVDSGAGWAHDETITAGGTVLDVGALDWDSDSNTPAHIAVLLDTKVEIWGEDSVTGNYVLDETFLGATSAGKMAILPGTTGEPQRRVAWSAPAAGNDYLLVLSEGGVRINCGTFDETPNSLLSAVHTESGLSRVDLLTTEIGSNTMNIYEHLSGSLPYDPDANGPVWDTGASMVAADGIPAFGDISHDRIPDGLHARALTQELHYFSGEQPQFSSLVTGQNAWDDPRIHDIEGEYRVDIKIPETAGGYEFWQVILWRSDDGTTLDPTAIANLKFRIDPIANVWQQLHMDIPLDYVPASETYDDFNEAFFMKVRMINLNGDVITSSSPAIHAGFARDPVTAGNMNPNNNTALPILDWDYPGDPPVGTPGHVSLAELPPVNAGVPPQIPSMVTGGACWGCN